MLKPIATGIMLAIPTCLLVFLLPANQGLDLLAVLLGAIGAVYAGFAISDGRTNIMLLELFICFGFIGSALAGLWSSPKILAIGYIAHGLWDVLHHAKGVQTNLARWYPPCCSVYDSKRAKPL